MIEAEKNAYTESANSAPTQAQGKQNSMAKLLAGKGLLPPMPLDIVQGTLRVRAEIASKVAVHLPPEVLNEADKNFLAGRPLLPRSMYVYYDKAQTAAAFGALLRLISEQGSIGLQNAANFLFDAMKNGALSLQEAVTAHIEDDFLFFADWSARMPAAPSLLRYLVRNSLAPSLEAISMALHKAQGADRLAMRRSQTSCPCCGSMPVMGALRTVEGEEGEEDAGSERWLSCSFCHYEYRSVSWACPFCGEDLLEKLHLVHDDASGFDIQLCDSCRCYIKLADLRGKSAKLSPMDDISSLHLDAAALDGQYVRAVGAELGL